MCKAVALPTGLVSGAFYLKWELEKTDNKLGTLSACATELLVTSSGSSLSICSWAVPRSGVVLPPGYTEVMWGAGTGVSPWG